MCSVSVVSFILKEFGCSKAKLSNKIVSGASPAGALVQVCQDHRDNCQFFTEIPDTQENSVIEMRSAFKRKGNMIRILITGSSLAICEMKIFGC